MYMQYQYAPLYLETHTRVYLLLHHSRRFLQILQRLSNDKAPAHLRSHLMQVITTLWFLGFATLVYTGSFLAAFANGVIGAWLGGFGHNFVHQPKYRVYGYTLDLLGFSSEGWYREHNLQHHMYTNTPLDNHFLGTEPFIKCNPRTERTWLQKWIGAYLNFALIFFGTEGNYIAHFVDMLKGDKCTLIMPSLMIPPLMIPSLII